MKFKACKMSLNMQMVLEISSLNQMLINFILLLAISVREMNILPSL